MGFDGGLWLNLDRTAYISLGLENQITDVVLRKMIQCVLHQCSSLTNYPKDIIWLIIFLNYFLESLIGFDCDSLLYWVGLQ